MRKSGKNEKQLGMMLDAVSRKLGMSPQQLRQALESGQLDAITHSGADGQKLEELLGNRQKLEQMMQSPQAKALYEKLMGGKS